MNGPLTPRLTSVLLLAWTLLAVPAAFSEPKALLIGISEFPLLDLSLPSVGADMENMRLVAARLGIEQQHTKLLENSGATLARVKAAIHGWMALGLSEEDYLLCYFSTYRAAHAAEPALLAYDSGPVLTLATLREMLSRLRAGRIYLIVDGPLQPGSETYADTAFDWQASNVMALSPRMPSYRNAIDLTSGQRGNTMTFALRQAIDLARQRQQPVDFDWLHEVTGQVLGDLLSVDPSELLDIGGATALRANPLPMMTAATHEPPLQTDFYAKLVESARPMSTQTLNQQMNIGDELELALDVPEAGFLNILSIDSSDQTVALFPNRHHRDNRVEPGLFHLPTAEMDFAIQAQPPAGATSIIALLTQEPIDVFALEGQSAEAESVFAEVSGATMHEFRKVGDVNADVDADFYGVRLEFEIVDPE